MSFDLSEKKKPRVRKRHYIVEVLALSVAGMACGAFGIMSVSVGAIAQECIDVLAIVWALTALRD